jgi:hypothetical protein
MAGKRERFLYTRGNTDAVTSSLKLQEAGLPDDNRQKRRLLATAKHPPHCIGDRNQVARIARTHFYLCKPCIRSRMAAPRLLGALLLAAAVLVAIPRRVGHWPSGVLEFQLQRGDRLGFAWPTTSLCPSWLFLFADLPMLSPG